MRTITSDRFSQWTSGAGLVAVGGLAWVVYVPGGGFWSAALAAGLIGSALLATVLLARRRAVPSLAQAVASAAPDGRREQAGRPGLGRTGERKP